MDVGTVAGQGSYVGHARVHVGSTYGVAYSFVLFGNGFVSLVIFVAIWSASTFIKEEFSLIKILLITGYQVQLGQCHFGYLMSGHFHLLAGVGADFSANAVGIADSDIQEVALSSGLVVSDGTFDHVSQVVELVAQLLHLFPAFAACPLVRMLGVHGAGGVQVAVGFLCSSHYHQYAVDVLFQFLVWIGLQQITGSFDGFVYVSIVKREASHFIVLAGMGSHFKVLVAAVFFAFAESQWDGYFTACFQALSPKGIRHFD